MQVPKNDPLAEAIGRICDLMLSGRIRWDWIADETPTPREKGQENEDGT